MLIKNLKRLAAGEKGYLGKELTDKLRHHYLKLIANVRKNMKNKLYSAFKDFS